MSTFVIDCAENYSKSAKRIKDLGAAGVIRYFNPLSNGHDSGKSLTPAEAKSWAAIAMPVGVVVEGWGDANGHGGIDGPSGKRDAERVLAWLPGVGFPPQPGLVVWFAVDTDATATQINRDEVTYFDAIRAVFNAEPAGFRPRVGIYGSGWSCMSMLGSKRADEAWVAGSPGWAHYHDYVATNGWRLLQKIYPGEKWHEFNADTDTVNGSLADAGLLVPFTATNPLFRPAPLPKADPLPGPPPKQGGLKQGGLFKAFADAFRRL
jgi:hypothetical protein